MKRWKKFIFEPLQDPSTETYKVECSSISCFRIVFISTLTHLLPMFSFDNSMFCDGFGGGETEKEH